MTNKKEHSSGVIEAAGGLLWRSAPEGEEIAIIHRPKYNDWTLPKGKKEPGESWIETALREVHEETGCLIRLKDFAGGQVYIVDGIPKVVLYWHMQLEQDKGFSPNEEVDQLLWLPPTKAIQRMSYPVEKRFLVIDKDLKEK